jgi:hypothetical protein
MEFWKYYDITHKEHLICNPTSVEKLDALIHLLRLEPGSKALGLQWYATDKYILSHPEDPDIPELLNKLNKEKNLYLKWERDSIGWAIYLFRKT